MAAPAPKAAVDRAVRKTRVGVVTSNKMQKTIVVRVANLVSHEKYSRVMGRASSFKVHDETNSAAIGDLVRIMETRPMSKDKRWRLVEIVQKASQAPAVPGSEEETRKTKESAPS